MEYFDPEWETTENCRDWLARDDGWYYLAGVEGDPVWCKVEALKTWNPSQENHPEGSQYEHPYPETLDAAVKAMPKGWRMFRNDQPGDGKWWYIEATQYPKRENGDRARIVSESEIEGRFRLAVTARLMDRDKAGKQDTDDGA